MPTSRAERVAHGGGSKASLPRVTTFCLVHGAWHDAACWDPVIDPLRAGGHDVVAPDLPLHDPAATFEERIEPALEAIEGLADPVIAVGHSMGAAYAPAIAARRAGSPLVYLCPGLGPLREGFPWPPARADGTCEWHRDAAIQALYPRLAPEAARRLADRLRPMAPAAGGYPRSRPRQPPTAVVIGLDDELFDPSSERAAAREKLGLDPIEIPGGHFPMVEDPDAVAALLDRVAREAAPA
jgi:pimeloyl-ACP methyl ester carboxylesterase